MYLFLNFVPLRVPEASQTFQMHLLIFMTVLLGVYINKRVNKWIVKVFIIDPLLLSPSPYSFKLF